ncbi:LPXTG cell wall anchor domain-containing protein [Cellulomonas chitinilytica]|uniref:LPXTG cell wall anchor domain-containing protein n=1 Tax=Cellulomonas chitinilytica TaxID=398759 RepID=UPI0023B30940|nr:LPXTG cell wall anchor domain-containing protein [Cellulomonas chitinilytica]
MAALAITASAAAAEAHGGSDRGGSNHGTWQKPAPATSKASTTPKTSATPTPSIEPGTATGAYVYRKRDASKKASWENSTQQYLVAAWPGRYYRPLTLAEVRAAVPVTVCGPGWAVQEDQAIGDVSLFTGSKAPSYPVATIGWPPITAAEHTDLEKSFEVPACGATTPAPTPSVTPTPTPTPTVTPSATPTVTPTSEVQPTQTPTTSATPTPKPTPTPSATSEVAAAPSPTPTPTRTPTPTPTIVSEVLAASGTGTLATTGSSLTVPLTVAVVLLLGGAGLVVLRRRGRAQGAGSDA